MSTYRIIAIRRGESRCCTCSDPHVAYEMLRHFRANEWMVNVEKVGS